MNNINFVCMRANPYHLGHKQLIEDAIDAGDFGTVTVVFIGSANKAGTLDNPFNFGERYDMIVEDFKEEVEKGSMFILPLVDYDYDDASWEEDLHKQLKQVAAFKFGANSYFTPKFFTCGKGSDAQLRVSWARGAEVVVVDSVLEGGKELSATAIRQCMIDGTHWVDYAPNVMKVIPDSRLDSVIHSMKNQQAKAKQYKESFASCPFEVQFSATDAVIRDNTGRLLFIVRGKDFGQGLMAMVGGFLEPQLTYEQNMKKEVLEETGIDLSLVPHKIVTSWFCDNPKRDIRGRMTTMAFLVQLDCAFEDLKITAGDDACDYKIIDSSELMNYILWADHAGIVRKLLHLEELDVKYIANH